jgi:hypothetical protein
LIAWIGKLERLFVAGGAVVAVEPDFDGTARYGDRDVTCEGDCVRARPAEFGLVGLERHGLDLELSAACLGGRAVLPPPLDPFEPLSDPTAFSTARPTWITPRVWSAPIAAAAATTSAARSFSPSAMP